MATKRWKIFGALFSIFLVGYYVPLGYPKVEAGVLEAFKLPPRYTRNHTPACVAAALSLPHMLVIVKVMGAKKNAAFCAIIVVVATTVGMIYGAAQGVDSNLVASTGALP